MSWYEWVLGPASRVREHRSWTLQARLNHIRSITVKYILVITVYTIANSQDYDEIGQDKEHDVLPNSHSTTWEHFLLFQLQITILLNNFTQINLQSRVDILMSNFCQFVVVITSINWNYTILFSYIIPTSEEHSQPQRYTLSEESSQTNVILQYQLLAAILSAVCSLIQQS